MPAHWPWTHGVGLAVLVTAAAATLVYFVGPLGPFTPALLLFMATVLTARVAGFSASLVSIALGAVAFYFLLPGWNSAANLITFGVVSVLSCAVTATLRNTRIQLARVLDSISDAFVVIDRSWRVQFVNRRAEELARRSADELIGRHVFEIFPELAQWPLLSRLDHARVERRPLRVETYYAPLDLWFEATLVVTADGVLVFGRDITARKKDEERLRSTLEIVEDANKQMVQFARAVTHDYVGPLSAIVSYAEILRMETSGTLRSQAQKIVELVGKANTLIRLYSEFSREPGESTLFVPLSLGAVIRQTEESFADLFRRSRVEVLHQDLPTVQGNHELMMLFFRHLVSLVLSARTSTAVSIRVSAEPREEGWTLRVTPRYTTPLEGAGERGDPLAKGRMAICRGIIERHGGRFWIEEDADGSLRFQFTLPSAQPELARLPG